MAGKKRDASRARGRAVRQRKQPKNTGCSVAEKEVWVECYLAVGRSRKQLKRQYDNVPPKASLHRWVKQTDEGRTLRERGRPRAVRTEHVEAMHKWYSELREPLLVQDFRSKVLPAIAKICNDETLKSRSPRFVSRLIREAGTLEFRTPQISAIGRKVVEGDPRSGVVTAATLDHITEGGSTTFYNVDLVNCRLFSSGEKTGLRIVVDHHYHKETVHLKHVNLGTRYYYTKERPLSVKVFWTSKENGAVGPVFYILAGFQRLEGDDEFQILDVPENWPVPPNSNAPAHLVLLKEKSPSPTLYQRMLQTVTDYIAADSETDVSALLLDSDEQQLKGLDQVVWPELEGERRVVACKVGAKYTACAQPNDIGRMHKALKKHVKIMYMKNLAPLTRKTIHAVESLAMAATGRKKTLAHWYQKCEAVVIVASAVAKWFDPESIAESYSSSGIAPFDRVKVLGMCPGYAHLIAKEASHILGVYHLLMDEMSRVGYLSDDFMDRLKIPGKHAPEYHGRWRQRTIPFPNPEWESVRNELKAKRVREAAAAKLKARREANIVNALEEDKKKTKKKAKRRAKRLKLINKEQERQQYIQQTLSRWRTKKKRRRDEGEDQVACIGCGGTWGAFVDLKLDEYEELKGCTRDTCDEWMCGDCADGNRMGYHERCFNAHPQGE